MQRNKHLWILFLMLFLCFIGQPTSWAQGTAFTYQSRLSDNGALANGTYDLEFSLFDALNGGSQIGTTLAKPNVTLSNGVFIVQLDFGANAFSNGGPRFLQIGVRKAGTSDAFTTLSPRTEITSTPYAIRSLSAVSADNATQLNGVAAGDYVKSDDARLSDARDPKPGSANYIQNGTTPQAGNFNISGNGTIGGNVGIGTNNPIDKLHVLGGSIRWGNSRLSDDQGGSIELGTPVGTTLRTPYIDFHYRGPSIKGDGGDFNVRLINDDFGQLSVVGSLNITRSLSVANHIVATGKIITNGGFNGRCLNGSFGSTTFNTSFGNACNMDLAESFRTLQRTEPGDVVTLLTQDRDKPTVRKASRAYDAHLVGVVSTNPGLVFDEGQTHLAGDNTQLITKDKTAVAMVGRVPVKFTLENGAIKVGDALTSSATEPGKAMKATSAGKIIGIALESSDKAQDGKLLMWLQIGHHEPTTPTVTSRNLSRKRQAAAMTALKRENATLQQQLNTLMGQFKTVGTRLDELERAATQSNAEARQH